MRCGVETHGWKRRGNTGWRGGVVWDGMAVAAKLWDAAWWDYRATCVGIVLGLRDSVGIVCGIVLGLRNSVGIVG